MKDSLRAAGGNEAKSDSRLKGPSVKKMPVIIKNGVSEDDIRLAVFSIKEKIITKYKRLDSAFKDIDTDRTGYLSREEFRFCLLLLNLNVISNTITQNYTYTSAHLELVLVIFDVQGGTIKRKTIFSTYFKYVPGIALE